MILIKDATMTLEVVLGGAITTNQLPVVATYVDLTATAFTPDTRNTVTNSTTAVKAVYAPGAGIKRQIKFLSVFNADTVAADVTIRLDDNGTTRVIATVTLAADSTLFYTDGRGFYVMDATGAIL